MVLALGGAVWLTTRHVPLATQQVGKLIYYCPMHPTYTSDRPGDCPICSMKLVSRPVASLPQPEASAALSSSRRDTRGEGSAPLESICYLHNCPKLHAGKPCPMTVVATPGEQVICPLCGTHIAQGASGTPPRKTLYWTDPMIPGYKASGPGISPMGMALVPVYEETSPRPAAASAAPEGYAPVLVTPEKQQLIGVKTAPVLKRAVTKTIRTVGTIAHDPELFQAQAEFIQAYQAWQRALAGNSPEVAKQAEQLAASSRLRLRHLGLSDPMIGEISTWSAPDHRLLVGGAGQYWVYASIYEYELALVHVGDTATIEVEAFPGQLFHGTMKAVDPMIDPATRTARARLLVEDPSGMLKPGMYVNVHMATALGETLVVPEEAVFATGERSVVFVDTGRGIFEPRRVTLGAKADGVYQLLEGVAEGERVVTSGNFLLDSESRLKGALQDMGEDHHGQ